MFCFLFKTVALLLLTPLTERLAGLRSSFVVLVVTAPGAVVDTDVRGGDCGWSPLSGVLFAWQVTVTGKWS